MPTSKTKTPMETPPQEVITNIPLSELYPFPNHPFQIRDDDAMKETSESIKEYDVLVPAIVRPVPDGGYEIVSGHRRKHASELAGPETMPCIVRDMDNDAATIIMVDSNLQRESTLCGLSEKRNITSLNDGLSDLVETTIRLCHIDGAGSPHLLIPKI